MHSKKHALHPLRLAILTVIFTSTHSTSYADSEWNCTKKGLLWSCAPSLPQENTSIEQSSLQSLVNSPVSDRSLQESTSQNNTAKQNNKNQGQLQKASQASSRQIQGTALSSRYSNAKASQLAAAKKTNANKKKVSHSTTNKPTHKLKIAKHRSTAVSQGTQELAFADPNEQTTIDYKTLDWYPYTNPKTNTNACKGRYISPQISNSTENSIPNLQTVFVSADNTNSELGKVATLQGNVDIKQGGRSLHSPLAELNQETGEFSLEQGVTYRQTGLLISGAKAEGNINEEEIRLHDIKYVLHKESIRGQAKSVTRKTQHVLELEQGSVTFCPPDDESWHINAKDIKIDTESGFGRAKNAKLEVFGTSILYLPVFYFPIDDRRSSGFLYPDFKISSSDSKVSIPYYFNIATNIDDTLTASLFSKRGLLLENEFRYLDKNSLNRLSTGFINDSEVNTNKHRWVVGVNHEGNYGNFNTVIDYTEVSDDDYFDDIGSNLDVDEGDNDHLNQTAKVTYNADTWQSSLLVQKYQTIDVTKTKPYQRLPEFRVSGSPAENFDNLDLNYRAVFTRFDRDQTGLTGSARTIGDRLVINPSINGSFLQTWGYIKPSVKLWHARYNLSDQPTGIADKQSVTVPVFELDSGLYFDRDFSFQNKSYTQTLEPRLYALYVPYEDQSQLPDFDTSELTFTYNSLFRDNRFSGDDRFGDAKQISLGLTSRAISNQGREIVSASIGHAFYFDDRRVRIDPNAEPLKNDTSDFATSLAWRPNSRVRALFDAAFDANTLDNSEMTLDLKYEEDPNHVIGIRHRFTRDTRKQTTLSYLWPIASQWSSLGLAQYDWRTNKTIDLAAGLEYQSCCWRTRIILRNELTSTNKRESSAALQFSLKGLGGIGKNPTKELSDKIKGYQKREYYNANN